MIAPFETIYSFASLFKGPCQMICPPVAELLDKCGELYHGYAYVFIGTHGYSLMTAGRKTFSLFVNEGVAVMENDCVIETLCLWADITIACITSVMAIMMVDHGPEYWTRGVDCPRTLCGLIGLFSGWCISGVATGVVVGANKAVLVLFLENPHVLEDTHPNEHKELTQAWRLVEKKEVPTTAHIAVHGARGRRVRPRMRRQRALGRVCRRRLSVAGLSGGGRRMGQRVDAGGRGGDLGEQGARPSHARARASPTRREAGIGIFTRAGGAGAAPAASSALASR